MKKIIFIVLISFFFPTITHAVTYDQILTNKASASRPYLVNYCQYDNIRWISHQPYFEGLTDQQMKELEQEALVALDCVG